MIRYIRRQTQPPTAAARAYWRAEGHLVGELLRPECALTLPQIVTATRERLAEQPEDGRFLTLTPTDVDRILQRLVAHGLAAMGQP